MSSSYPRETLEFIFVDFALNGVPVTSATSADVQVCVVPLTNPKTRPGAYVPIETLETGIGFLIGPGAGHDYSQLPGYPADYMAWVTDDPANPESPVVDCGTFRVT